MRLSNRLVIAAFLGALVAGCGTQQTPTAGEREREKTPQKLETVVRAEAPKVEEPEIDAQTIRNKWALYDALVLEENAFLRRYFGTNYADFVSDFAGKIVYIRYERAQKYLEPAEKIAARMGPNRDFYADLVRAVFDRAARIAKDRHERLAEDAVKLGVMVAKKRDIDTRDYLVPVLKAASEKAASDTKDGYFGLAKNNVGLIEKLAKEYGANPQVHIRVVVQASYNKALEYIDGPYGSLAKRPIEFGRQLAAKHGLKDLAPMFDALAKKVPN